MSRYTSQEWEDLKRIQNRYFPNQDIMTITGFMNHEQFMNHVKRYKEYEEELSN